MALACSNGPKAMVHDFNVIPGTIVFVEKMQEVFASCMEHWSKKAKGRCGKWCLFFDWIKKVKIFSFFYLAKSNLLISINITKHNKFTLIMLVDINILFLVEYKKLNILAFFIQPKNKHHRSWPFFVYPSVFGRTIMKDIFRDWSYWSGSWKK